MSVYIKNYSYSPAKLYPIDNAHPEEYDYDIEVISDLTGDDITGEAIWLIDDEDVCSEEEMLDYFNSKYVSDVDNENEYQKGKEWLIKVFDYEEKDFENHPPMLKINVPYGRNNDYQYALENDFDPIGNDYLPDDWRELDAEELSEIGFNDFDEYDDGDRAYDEWRDRQLTDEN